MMWKQILALGLALVTTGPVAASDISCGEAVACRVTGGDYRIAMPANKPVGAYVYFHGYMGSAEDQMRQRKIVETVLAHHLAFVALDGSEGRWAIRDGWQKGRDDQAYLTDVLDDLHRRNGFGPGNTLVGGFSLGASMAWYAACRQGARFAGMVTFSGVFWDPLPAPGDCIKDLPPMIHVHGRADGTFPLAGRAIGDHERQGDTFGSIAIYRERAACKPPRPGKSLAAGLDCEVASGCARGESMLCLHPGGHVVRPGDLDAALTALGFPK